MFVKDFLISTKFQPKRIEHLQDQEFISSELYFSEQDIELILYLFVHSVSGLWPC